MEQGSLLIPVTLNRSNSTNTFIIRLFSNPFLHYCSRYSSDVIYHCFQILFQEILLYFRFFLLYQAVCHRCYRCYVSSKENETGGIHQSSQIQIIKIFLEIYSSHYIDLLRFTHNSNVYIGIDSKHVFFGSIFILRIQLNQNSYLR